MKAMSPTLSLTKCLPLVFGIIFLTHKVLCINKAPVWDTVSMDKIKETFTRQVYENTTENKLLGTLLAFDPEGKTVTYGVDSENTVKVDSITGEVKLARSLDREKGDTKVDVIFFAYDPFESNVRNTIDYPTRLDVQDINDNAPNFQNLPYGASVFENTPDLTTVFSGVKIEDLDDGYNAEVFINCYTNDEQSRTACETFGLSRLDQTSRGVYNCSIFTKQALDYETQISYIITLRAVDNGVPRLTSLVNVHIKVIDVQDSPPEFLNTPVNLYTNESVPANSKIGEIQARDRDQGNPRPIKIVILPGSSSASLFRLVPQTVANPSVQPLVYTYDVFSTTTLDREILRGQAAFGVMAIELENGVETTINTTTTVLVNIFDVNDNPPRFDQDVYYINASESVRATDNTQIPGLTMTVRDLDDASNARFSVTIQSQTFPGAFAVSPTNATSQGPFALAVINADFMDYEVESYRNQRVVVVAREIGTSNSFSSSATVFVSLLDVNDNSPVFSEKEYSFSVQENTNGGLANLITLITATDADSGVNGEIRYQIDEGADTNINEFFQIDGSTGHITILKAIDYEENREFPLVISATDQGSPKRSTKVVLRVDVKNMNDIPPKFVVPSYQTRITETTTNLQPAITVQATDTEEGSGLITYRIFSGNDLPNGPAFYVDASSGQLSMTRTVNFNETPNSRGYFLLVIEASDNATPSPALVARVEVRINVQDENNYDARFDKLVYNASVSELATVGTSVIQVQAKDEDTGENGRLTFSLQGSLGDFEINPTSGLITVSAGAQLDSSRSLYRLTVVAADNGSPRQRSSSATVNVRIMDKNNKVPSFTEALYTATVSEEESLNRMVLQVTATDPDQNSSLIYEILDYTIRAKDPKGALFNNPDIFNFKASFYIDADDGEVRIQNQLSYENVAEMDFAVQVKDLYAEPSSPLQTATASVNIRILGSVDATPTFVAPWKPNDPTYYFTIPEETEKNTLITTLVAVDPLAQRNIENFVEVESVDEKNYFYVDRKTGSLLVNKKMDFDTLISHSLPVEVQAISDDGKKTAIARIRIQIRDINDNNPVFDQKQYVFEVYESLRYPRTIGVVLATDADSGEFKEIQYSLSGQGAEKFQIYPSGTVIIANGTILDREERALYELTVTATDNPKGRTQRQSSVQMVIKILDENDSKPKFTRDSYNFLTVDSTGVGSVIGQVEASDQDTGLNSEVIYTMLCADPKAQNLFLMNIFTGEVTIESPLDGQLKMFVCNTTASDQGKPPLSRTVPVLIQVSSGSDSGIPTFVYPAGKTGYESNNVTENSPAGVVVGRIFATSLVGNVTYSFVDNSDSQVTSKFSVDPLTGEVQTRVPLDREEEKYYELYINADVTGNTTLSNGAVLRVYIQDLNDNIPVFTGQGCDTDVYSSQPFRVYPQEGTRNGTRLLTFSACDRDDPEQTTTNYQLVSRVDHPTLTALNIDCVPANMSFYKLVKIDRTKVAIDVDKTLDHDIANNGKQLLCIQAADANTLSTNGRKKRQATYNQLNKTVLYVEVNIVDINDNGPLFPEKLTQAVILEFPSADQLVKQVTAKDLDAPPYDRVRYSIQSTTFIAQDNSMRNITIAFDIDSFTGEVRTKLVRYTQFISGRFDIIIRAEDSLKSEFSDTTMLQVSVLQVGQRLKVTWSNTNNQQGDASLMTNVQTDIQEAVSSMKWQLTVDELRYHIDNKGIKDDSKFDACFVVLDDNGRSPSKDEVTAAIRTSKSLDSYDVGFCDSTTSAGLGGGATYWWVLIALAVIIFVGTVILIIVSLILAARLKNKQDHMKTSLIQN